MEKVYGMDRGEKFREDLDSLLSTLNQNMPDNAQNSLRKLRDRLVELHESNLVKINHSIMELVCAKLLILKGHDVEIEHQLESSLTCDLYAVKGEGNLIVEIETGFVPPEHALDPSLYLLARIASKITRYSNRSGKFSLGIPPQYALQIPEALSVPPRDRTTENLKYIKGMCDLYYTSPPVGIDEVRNARLHSIYLIDVDKGDTKEIDPETYIKCRPAFLQSVSAKA